MPTMNSTNPKQASHERPDLTTTTDKTICPPAKSRRLAKLTVRKAQRESRPKHRRMLYDTIGSGLEKKETSAALPDDQDEDAAEVETPELPTSRVFREILFHRALRHQHLPYISRQQLNAYILETKEAIVHYLLDQCYFPESEEQLAEWQVEADTMLMYCKGLRSLGADVVGRFWVLRSEVRRLESELRDWERELRKWKRERECRW